MRVFKEGEGPVGPSNRADLGEIDPGLGNFALPHGDRRKRSAPSECKAVALDLDGTLLNSACQLPAGAREVVQALVESGRPVILASGRPPRSVQLIQAELGLSGPAVALNGGWVGTRAESYFSYAVPTEYVQQALQLRADHSFHLYTDRHWFVNSMADPEIIREIGAVGYAPDGALDSGSEADLAGVLNSVLKITVEGAPQEIAKLHREFTKPCVAELHKPGSLEIMGSVAFGAGDKIPVNKVVGTALLLRELDLKLSDLLFFGDGRNDERLLAGAGYSVSFTEASKEVASFSDEVIERCEGEGVLRYLERCFRL